MASSFVTNELLGPAVYFKFDIDPYAVGCRRYGTSIRVELRLKKVAPIL